MAQRKTALKTRGRGRAAAKSAKTSPKTRAGSGRRSTTGRKSSAGAREVTIDRRRNVGRRKEDGAGARKPTAAPPKLERRKKVVRRRQIDPTTCERDYTDDEVQFMSALDNYKRASGRMFPTCSEVLEVVRSLGYVKLPPGELARRSAADSSDQASPPSDSAGAAAHNPDMVSSMRDPSRP